MVNFTETYMKKSELTHYVLNVRDKYILAYALDRINTFTFEDDSYINTKDIKNVSSKDMWESIKSDVKQYSF